MLEKYYRYKVNYNKFLILLKYGSFYELFSNDALIMNNLFNYKIKKISNSFKVGFPISKLNEVIKVLDNNNISYVVVEENEIILKDEKSNNNYSNYNFDVNKVLYNILRIDKIYKYLNDNLMNENIDNILSEMEKIYE